MKETLKVGYRKHTLSAAIAAAISLSTHIYAQQQVQLEEISVTGTRIRITDGMSTPVPVTAVTTAELQNFDPGGTVAEQLDALPQFFGTQTSQRGGSPLFDDAGGSYLNMRDLGMQRTLILLDGSRVPPADKRGPVNVDLLPTALVRTVDVVTGGASAAYGADALGGVTNFVLDREFEGLKIETGTGVTEWGDGERWNLSVAAGRDFGERLHIIASAQALHINQIWRDPEELGDWYQRWGFVTNPAWAPGAAPGTPQRLTLPWVASTEHSPTGMLWARRGTASTSPLIPFTYNGYVFTDDGQDMRPFIKGDVYAAPNLRGSTKSMSGGPEAMIRHRAFEGGPSGNEVVNRSGFLGAKYDVSNSLSAFAQVLVGRSESRFRTMRGGTELSDGWHMNVYRDNAFLPEEVGAAMDEAGITSVQLWKNGGLIENLNSDIHQGESSGVFTTWAWSVGFDAVLPNGWDWRASWQSGESHKRGGIYDKQRADRIALAMDAVRDPATGAIVCNVQLYNPTPEQLRASVAGRLASPGGTPGGTGVNRTTEPLASPIGLDNSIRDCIPFNVFGMGHTPQAVIDYVTTPKIGDSYVNQDFAETLVTGELIEGWNGPISFAAGLTWREQDFVDHALPREIDVLGPPLNAPELGIRGLGPSWTNGSANLHTFSTIPDVFGAYDVWEWFGELNVPIWQSRSSNQVLGGSAAYRSSDYSNVGRVESWKLGLDFQLFEDLRLRATRSHDVREATFSERFDAQATGGNVNDPRFNNIVTAITTVQGGNPALAPESANTLVLGFVYQPSWLAGLSLSADWYDVQIDDAISTLGNQRIVNECEINKVQELCGRIQRDPVTGFIGRIFNVPLNVAQARVRGLDYEAAYRMEPDFLDDEIESLSVRLLAGYIQERSNTPLGGTPQDQIGELGSPELTAVLTGSYGFGPWSLQLQQRYITDTLLDINWVEGLDVDDNSISSGNYTNLRLGYQGEMGSGATWNVGFNVNNLFDRHPPIVPGFGTRGGSQSVPNGYDIFGRRYQLNLNLSF